MVPSYPATLDFLYGLQKHGIKLGLNTIRTFLSRMGRPQDRYQSLHIGGTNGKGSTAAIAAAVLRAAGYRVGLYTSPHLIDFRERILVDGVPIPEESVRDLTEYLRACAGGDLSPTFFEFTTAMALLYFAQSGVQVAVLEVGMGGRFDATNIVVPSAVAITNVALDHQEYLGKNTGAIAFEKAGIVKTGVPVVCGMLSEDAAAVIGRVATDRGAASHWLGRDFRYGGTSPSRFRYEGLTTTWEDLFCPLQGEYQLENASCALALLELAAARGVEMNESAVRQGLQSVRWEGRLEIAETHPLLLMDGAHNPAAAAAVARYLFQYRAEHPLARVVAVIGMMRDKDRNGFFQAFLPSVNEVILTEPHLARAASVHELSTSLGEASVAVHVFPDPADALALARRLAAPDDVICVTGSLMLVGEVTALLRGCGLSSIRG